MKDIIVALAKHLESGTRMEEWVGLNIDRFLSRGKVTVGSQVGNQRRARYGSLFAQRDFDLRYVLSVGDLLEIQKTDSDTPKPGRGYLLAYAREEVTR